MVKRTVLILLLCSTSLAARVLRHVAMGGRHYLVAYEIPDDGTSGGPPVQCHIVVYEIPSKLVAKLPRIPPPPPMFKTDIKFSDLTRKLSIDGLYCAGTCAADDPQEWVRKARGTNTE